MDLLTRYEIMIGQSLEELGPVQMPEDTQEQFEIQAQLAPDLGDILYRLSIEHGVPYTPFRDTVIKLITEPLPQEAAVRSKTDKNQEPRIFGAEFEDAHPLILLALEMMPPDHPY